MKIHRFVLFGLFLVGLVAAIYFLVLPRATADTAPDRAKPEAYRAVNLDPKAKEPALLWNGILGVRINRLGLGRDAEGDDLPAFHCDLYESTGEEKIVPALNVLNFDWEIGGKKLEEHAIENYTESLDFKTGVLSQSYRLVGGGPSVTARVLTYLPPGKAVIRQEWRFESQGKAIIKMIYGPKEIEDASWSLINEGGGYEAFTLTDVDGQGFDGVFELEPRRVATVRRQIQVPYPLPAAHREALETYNSGPITAGFDRWDEPDAPRFELDGPVEDQQALSALLFYLRTSIDPARTQRVSPMVLSNSQYFGHVFWDADLWVFPALALLDPARASVIPQYRLDHMPAYSAEGKAYTSALRPARSLVTDALKVPWESSMTGKETVPGPSRKELHITGTVAYSLDLAASLGLADLSRTEEFGKKAATFWSDIAPIENGKRVIKDVMSPDENHIGDNDLYTNMIAEWCMRRYLPNQPVEFYFPQDDKGFLTYDGDRVRGYKQTAALLTVFPLQDARAVAQAKTMFDRFADKTSRTGPAMSDSIHATIAARLGKSSVAYNLWRASWYDFCQHPLMLFSEKRGQTKTYFATGAAGSLQTVLYGFAGIQIDTKPAEGAKVKLPLLNGRILSIKPNLPKDWRRLTIRNLSVLGKKYDLTMSGTSAKLVAVALKP
ncbi:MAG: glycoside hydrolase family 65 protein [Armatimonadetes bacterium]|nr:glycoside hydrolase family 65 protein [Armatimonadota bacterium]